MVKSKKQHKEMPYNKNQIAIITSNVVNYTSNVAKPMPD